MSNYFGFEPTDEPNYFFISYNSEDVELISPILLGLKDILPLWYDIGISYGEDWNQQIAERIEQAEAVLLFVTRGIFLKGTKSYVYKEYEMAKEFFGKKIHIIIMEQIKNSIIPKEMLAWWIEIRHVQCIQGYQLSRSEIIAEIRKAVGLNTAAKCLLRDSNNNCYPLQKGANYVGRLQRKANIVILDPSISSLHCRLTLDRGKLILEDLGALNGTYLGDKRIASHTPTIVSDGDHIRLGNYDLFVDFY